MREDILDFILRHGDKLIIEHLAFRLGKNEYRIERRIDVDGYYYTLFLLNKSYRYEEVHSAGNIIDLIRAFIAKAESGSSARVFGHDVIISPSTGRWIYSDDKTMIGHNRRCPQCGDYPTKEGGDPCIGILEGVSYACCGHGDERYAYVAFKDGSDTLRGQDALEYFRRFSSRVWLEEDDQTV